jgi:hypothetical protein
MEREWVEEKQSWQKILAASEPAAEGSAIGTLKREEGD